MIGWWEKGLTVNYNQYEMALKILCGHKTAYLAPLYMVLAPVGAVGGTRDCAVAQQEKASQLLHWCAPLQLPHNKQNNRGSQWVFIPQHKCLLRPVI